MAGTLHLFLLLAAAILSLTPATVRGQGTIRRFLEPGRPQELSLTPEEEIPWICQTPSPVIVWFFATAADPQSKPVFKGDAGVTGNPVWLRSGGKQNPTAAVRLHLSGNAPLSSKVRVWAETEAEFDVAEPNDRFGQAGPLPKDGARFFLYPKGDQDWFAFSLQIEGDHSFEVTLPSGASNPFPDGLELGLSDAQERPLVQRIGSPDACGVWRTVPFQVKPGAYRCWIKARGDRSSRSALTLRLAPAAEMSSTPAPPPLAQKSGAPAGTAQTLAPAPAATEAPLPNPASPQNPGTPSRWPWIFALALFGTLFWLASSLMRPRRVFDLTR